MGAGGAVREAAKLPKKQLQQLPKAKGVRLEGKGEEGSGVGPRLDGDQQTNHNNHTEIKLIKMRGPLARQATFKNINKN